jgi:hypothetical protein
MKHYRKIWRDHYGEIPVDENGITFDIDINSNNVRLLTNIKLT